MKKKPASLAKTTRPQLPQVFPRKRLFHLLDRARRRPIIWVTGPPGAGKTTLVASYLEARKLPALWYQLDGGDADIATFFSYMGVAAKHAVSRRRKPLPFLTPEYWIKLSVFTRRYFRDLYQRMGPSFTVVFDNYQEVPTYSRFHEVVSNGLSEIPKGGCAIVLSRDQPPPSMARFRASNSMEILSSDKLRLSVAESNAIVRLRGEGKVSKKVVQQLHRKTRGWAAGLVLMLEDKRPEKWVLESQGDPNPGGVFDYFAGEIFQKEDSLTQDFLLKTAFLGKMSAQMAAQLTGSPRADRILAELNRRNFFTERRFHSAPVYQYHPLFQDFLLSRAKETFTPSRLVKVQRSAAALLAEAEYVEDAAGLLREAADWEGLARLILKQAPSLMAQGRTLTLEDWLGSLPPDFIEKHAWLQYWLGSCRLMVVPTQSRAHFERAFQLFETKQDLEGLLSSWCGAVGSILYEWGDFTQLDHWITRLEEILQNRPAYPSTEVEARVASDMFGALMFRCPEHSGISAWAERAFLLSRKSPDSNRRLLTGLMLTLYHLWMGDLAKAAIVVDSLGELARFPTAPPLVQTTHKLVGTYYQWHTNSLELCLRTVSEGLAIAQSTGVQVWNSLLLAQGAAACLSSGDLVAAKGFLQQMAAGLEGTRWLSVSHYHYLAAWESMLSHDLPLALEHADVALKLAVEMGAPFPEALAHLAMAQVLHERGEHQRAAGHVDRALEIGRQSGSRMLQFMAFLAKSHFALGREDKAAGVEALRLAMTLGREQGYANTSWWRPSMMAGLCASALEAGIEVEYVQGLIRKRGLVCDRLPMEVEQWPWVLKVYSLGEFQLMREGEPIRFSRKVQQKPLAMMKALIAFGGRDVPEEKLADTLWPEAEGDAAHRALATTLHRLRQLVGHEKAVQLQGGLVGLSPRYCWVDTWAFESLLDQAGAAERKGGKSAAMKLVEKAISLYRGPFLAGGSLPPWAMSTSERLRGLFLRYTGRLGGWWEEKDEWRNALECYERALQVDDLAEDFYQRLMSCYRRLGRRAEALAVYQRCRRILAARLGVEPSAETEALCRTLRQK